MDKIKFFVLLLFLFISCTDKINFLDDKSVYIGETDPVLFDKIFLSENIPAFLLWKDFKLFKRDLLSKKNMWQFLSEFNPRNLFIEKEDGTKSIPQSIEDIKSSSDKKYSAFVMRLGISMNTTIGLVDIKENKVFFSYKLKEHKPVSGRRFEIIAFENVFTNPVFSDDNKFLACDVYNYLNIRKIRILDILTGQYKEIDNAIYPCFIKDKLYFVDIDINQKKTFITFYDYNLNKIKRVLEINEYVFLFKKINNNIFIASKDNFYYFNEVKKELKKIFSFADIKNEIKDSEIMRIFICNYKGKYYSFFILKILKNNKYIWHIYGKTFIF